MRLIGISRVHVCFVKHMKLFSVCYFAPVGHSLLFCGRLTRQGMTPLYIALRKGNVPMAVLLLQSGANADIPGKVYGCPLGGTSLC